MNKLTPLWMNFPQGRFFYYLPIVAVQHHDLTRSGHDRHRTNYSLATGPAGNKKRHLPKEMPLFLPLWITLPAQPCWNGGIWYKRTHGTEYR